MLWEFRHDETPTENSKQGDNHMEIVEALGTGGRGSPQPPGYPSPTLVSPFSTLPHGHLPTTIPTG